MNTITLTFEYTLEFASEAEARAGGRGDAIASIIEQSRSKHVVRVERAREFIADMAAHGYVVVDAGIPALVSGGVE